MKLVGKKDTGYKLTSSFVKKKSTDTPAKAPAKTKGKNQEGNGDSSPAKE